MSQQQTFLVIAVGRVGYAVATAVLAQKHKLRVLVRNKPGEENKEKEAKLKTLRDAGAEVFEGSLDDLELVRKALVDVNVVVSSVTDILKQLNILPLLKDSKTLTRFIPSEFGTTPPQSSPPGEVAYFDSKVKVQDALVSNGIPFTVIFPGGFLDLFVNTTVGELFGDGNVKVNYTSLEDIGTITVKAALDERTKNKSVWFDNNYLTQLEFDAAVGIPVEGKAKVSKEEALKRIEDAKAAGELWGIVKNQLWYYFYFAPGSPPEPVVYVSKLYPDVKIQTVAEFLAKHKKQ